MELWLMFVVELHGWDLADSKQTITDVKHTIAITINHGEHETVTDSLRRLFGTKDDEHYTDYVIKYLVIFPYKAL